MICQARGLLNGGVHAGSRKCSVQEIFFTPDQRRIRYLALDIGGWFDTNEVLISADLLRAPEDETDHWRLDLDERTLSKAPRWDDGIHSDNFDLRAWPPIFVGPFGGTYSPILMYEQLEAERRDREGFDMADDDGDALVFRMERATEWLGLPAFGRGGELGKVDDIFFDCTTRILTGLSLTEGALLQQSTRQVPIDAVRHMADQGTHLILDLVGDGMTETDAKPTH